MPYEKCVLFTISPRFSYGLVIVPGGSHPKSLEYGLGSDVSGTVQKCFSKKEKSRSYPRYLNVSRTFLKLHEHAFSGFA